MGCTFADSVANEPAGLTPVALLRVKATCEIFDSRLAPLPVSRNPLLCRKNRPLSPDYRITRLRLNGQRPWLGDTPNSQPASRYRSSNWTTGSARSARRQ